MKLKPIVITVVILGGLVGGGLLMKKSQNAVKPTEDERVGNPLLAEEKLGDVADVTIMDSSGSARVKLDDAGEWIVPDYHELPVDFSKLKRLIDGLKDAEVLRKVTANPDRIARLEFAVDSIIAKDKNGENLLFMTLGKRADGGGRYVRFQEDGPAYLADLNTWLDTTNKNWAKKQLIEFESEDVKSVTVELEDKSAFMASRENKEDSFAAVDAPEGRALKVSEIMSLVNRLRNPRFQDVAELTDQDVVDAREHARKVEITLFDNTVYAYSLGRRPEEVLPMVFVDSEEENAEGEAEEEKEPETKPAGPVYVKIASNREDAAINRYMEAVAFKYSDNLFTDLPATLDDLLEEKVEEPVEAVAETVAEKAEEAAEAVASKVEEVQASVEGAIDESASEKESE